MAVRNRTPEALDGRSALLQAVDMNETNDTPEDRDDEDGQDGEETSPPAEEHKPRTGPLSDDEAAALEETIRSEIQSHLADGGAICRYDYGVRPALDGEDMVYAPIAGRAVCILGILAIGHVQVVDLFSTVREVYGLKPIELDSLEIGWMSGHLIPATQENDSRCYAIGTRLAAEFGEFLP